MKFDLKLETRNVQGLSVDSKFPKYVVRGYAVAPEIEHTHTFTKDRSGKILKTFKSLFTKNAVASMNRQLAHKNVFVDALHEVASGINSKHVLNKMKATLGDKLADEISSLESSLKMKELPLLKPTKFEVRDKGLYMEMETNPFFAEVDESHEKYYKAITGSLLNNMLNGMSVNFKTKEVVNENGIDKIDDVELFGISLVPNAALGADSSITEVAMRSIQEVLETREETMEKQEQEVPKIDESQIQKMVEERLNEELKKREIENQKKEQATELEQMKQQVEQLQKEKEERSKVEIQPKGLVEKEPEPQSQMSQQELNERITNLTPGEAIMLQADPALNGVIPKLVKVQDYDNKKNSWYQTVTKWEPMPVEMEQMHNALARKEGKDTIYK
jgi:hypothetical protein